MDAVKEFGRLMRKARRDREWTQETLAERSGCTETYINRIEKGKAPRVSLEKAVALAAVLQLNLRDIQGEKEHA